MNPTDERGPDRRLWGYAALGLAALALYGWLESLPDRRAAGLPRLQAGEGRATGARPEASKRYAQLVSLLQELASEAAAREFAEEFLREPRLESSWKRIEGDQDVEAFVARLKASGEFHALLLRHGRKPDFQSMVEKAITRHPDLAESLRAVSKRAPRPPDR